MIARFWVGRTRAADADRYVEYLKATGVPAQRGTPGNLRSLVLRRLDGDEAEFVVLSLWDSPDAIRAFAGDDMDRAVYFPQDREFLLALPPRLTHYDVVVDEGSPWRA